MLSSEDLEDTLELLMSSWHWLSVVVSWSISTSTPTSRPLWRNGCWSASIALISDQAQTVNLISTGPKIVYLIPLYHSEARSHTIIGTLLDSDQTHTLTYVEVGGAKFFELCYAHKAKVTSTLDTFGKCNCCNILRHLDKCSHQVACFSENGSEPKALAQL